MYDEEITLPTGDFTYHKPTRTFSAEDSDFRARRVSLTQFKNVRLFSDRGGERVFRYKGPERDREGEITQWVWVCDDRYLDGVPLRIVIFND